MSWLITNLDSILAGIVASLIAVSLQTTSTIISGVVTSFLAQRIFYKRLFLLGKNQQTHVISGSIPQRKDKDLAFLMGPDASASVNVRQTIESIFPKMVVKHRYSDGKNAGFLDENVVAVGGPVFNATTALLLNQVKDILRFNEEDELLVRDSIYAKSKERMVDYGFVCRINNPACPQLKATIIAGCGSNGVLAASQLLTKSNRFKNMKSEFKIKRGIVNCVLNRDFVAVVQASIVDNDVANVHVIDVITLKGEK